MSIWNARVWAANGEMPGALRGQPEGAPLGELVRDVVRAGTSPWMTVEEAALGILGLEREGALRLEVPVASERLARLRDLIGELRELLDGDPGTHNVVGDMRAWWDDPEHYDFVSRDTDLGVLKRFERDLYLSHLEPFLEGLGPGARLLDAGCGPGRFAEALARRGNQVTMVDASPEALRRAVAHALEAGASMDTLEAHAAEVQCLDMCEDGSFDGALAMEVICYQTSPLASLRELARVVRPGGIVVVSVEGRYGSLLASSTGVESFEARLRGARLEREGDVCVTYFTEASLTELVVEAGLICEGVFGTHYAPEGPMGSGLDIARLQQPGYRAQVAAVEGACGADPILRPLARAWLAVARRPA